MNKDELFQLLYIAVLNKLWQDRLLIRDDANNIHKKNVTATSKTIIIDGIINNPISAIKDVLTDKIKTASYICDSNYRIIFNMADISSIIIKCIVCNTTYDIIASYASDFRLTVKYSNT